MYVLDHTMQPVSIGMPGELFIGGGSVARGYLNQPTITAEKFVPDPFSQEPGARLYRTGDLMRFVSVENEPPILEFLGRTDFQLKIRGFRIELGEIKVALSQHPNIREVVVLARENALSTKRLVAYFVTDVGQAPATEDLREHLLQTLPEYMVPSAFISLDAMPLTANGKVNRDALPTPDTASRPELRELFVVPSRRTEETLARIWCEVLRLERLVSTITSFLRWVMTRFSAFRSLRGQIRLEYASRPSRSFNTRRLPSWSRLRGWPGQSRQNRVW